MESHTLIEDLGPSITQAVSLPEITQKTIPSITKLAKNGSFTLWEAQVQTTLSSLGLDSLISTIPRPIPREEQYSKWRVWSVAVRTWLFGQMTDDMMDYVLVFYRQKGEKGPLPRYADEVFQLIKLASKENLGTLNRAVINFWSIRRASYSSPEEYVKEWVDAVDNLRSSNHPITTYMATEIMCTELENDIPGAVSRMRAKLQGNESTLGASAFAPLAQELLNECHSNKENISLQEIQQVLSPKMADLTI